MIKCSKCRKEKQIESYLNLKNKKYKNCFECREKCKNWREKNKQRVSEYNKLILNVKNNNKLEITVIYAKKKELTDIPENWIKFESQINAAKELNLYPANINKVIKGQLKMTGGYNFKSIIEKKEKLDIENWDKIKEKNSFGNLSKGKPSNHRVLHETINTIIGKKCCKCKEWNPLTEYNKDKNHWDKLRVECKKCLVEYRKKNRKQIQKTMTKYETKRKLIDPEFKLIKTLRSRLNGAIKCQNAQKLNTTMELTGCTISFLKGYLEAKFTDGMTWDCHGDWHIDHIKPCSSFNFKNTTEQQQCFHYTNLQPLWAIDNLCKGDKII